jgi:brefeldin A-resistance guanine nucleotide exchange factor 1
MLNTDLHNPNMDDAKRMTLDQFIRNNRGINDGMDLPVQFLEELYFEIKNNEIQVKNNTAHDGVDNFDGLMVGRANLAAPFFMSSYSTQSKFVQAGVHERDMYVAISAATTRAISTVFVQSWDDTLVVKALNGLRSSANICAYFGLTKDLDELIDLLLSWGQDYVESVAKLIHLGPKNAGDDHQESDLPNDHQGDMLDISRLNNDLLSWDLPPLPSAFVTTLNPESTSDLIQLDFNDVAGSAAHRGLLSLHYALLLCKNHLSIVDEALPALLEVIFALRDIDALPPRLNDLDDFADCKGNPLGPSTFATNSLARAKAYKSTFASLATQPNSKGLLTIFSFGNSHEPKAIARSTTNPLIFVLKTVSDKASMDSIIMKMNDVNMAKRILSSMLSAMYPEAALVEELITDPSYEENAVFVLELAARLLISNRSHSNDLLPLFISKFDLLTSTQDQGKADTSILGLNFPYLLERVVVTILRAVIHLYDVPDIRAQLVQSLELISRLPFSYTKEISARLGCGAAIILRGCFFLFETPDEWIAIRNILDIAAQHESGRPFVFDGIASLIEYAFPVIVDGEPVVVNGIDLSADGCEILRYILLKFLEGSYDNDLRYKLASMLYMKRVYSRQTSSSEYLTSDSVGQEFEWAKMVSIMYNDVCLSEDTKTSKKGFESLQEVILSTKVDSIPDEDWLTLMNMTCKTPPVIMLQGCRIDSLSLIGRLFLTLMPELSNRKENWAQLEDCTLEVAKMVGENLRSDRSSPLFEMTVHTVSNMCNVMSMAGFNTGTGINFCSWVGDTLLCELEKVGACGGVDTSSA